MTITINATTPGTLIVSGFGTAPLSGSGQLIKFNFNAIGAIGTVSPLTLTSFMFNEGVPCVSVSSGQVTIISGSVAGNVSYSNAAGPPSGPPLPVGVPNVTMSAAGSPNVIGSTNSSGNYLLDSFGPGSYAITPSKTGNVNGISAYDSALIAQFVVNLISLTATQQSAADVSQNNSITSFDAALIAQFVVLIPNIGNTGTWKFTPPSRNYANFDSSFTGENYGAILMGEVSGNWNPAAPDQLAHLKPTESDFDSLTGPGIGVTAPTLFIASSTNFNIPITVQDTTGQGIISYQYDLNYSPSVITPQGTPCDLSGTISSSLSVVCNPISPGTLKVAVFGITPISGAGILMKLKFMTVGPQLSSSPLTLVNFQFNEGVPQDVTTDGSVSIIGPTSAGASLSGRLLDSNGNAVPRTRICITDSNGQSLTAISNIFGYYRFDNLAISETYVLTVKSRDLTFTPRAISIQDDVMNFNLIAEP